MSSNRVYWAHFTLWLILSLGGAATAQSSPVAAQDSGGAFSVERVRDHCIEFRDVKQGDGPTDYRECRVSAFGEFGAVGGQTYYYAVYCLMPNETTAKGECGDDSFTARYHRARGLAVFVRDSLSNTLRLVFDRASPEIGTAVYEKPEIVQNAAGTLLHLPIVTDGTGVGNESEYYVRAAGTWEPIEAGSWIGELQKRLPAGLDIWKGVWPDLHTMRAEAGLYRPSDANCCPTGGTAKIQLGIRARRFVIDSVVIDKAP